MPINGRLTGVTTVPASNSLPTNNGSDPTWGGTLSLDSTSNLNVVLSGIDENADADLRVYRDNNNNGEFNSRRDELIGSSIRVGNSDDSINLESVAAGDYIVEAYLFSGDNTNIDLSVTTTDPSNLLPTEFEVGTLNGTQSFTDFVGRTDTADVYHFRVDTGINFSLSLTDLSADADVQLIQDNNNNFVVEPNEVIGSSRLAGNANDSISQFLNPGDYFVQVYQYNGNTDYTLSLTA